MRSVERLTRSPGAFRELERQRADEAIAKLVADNKAAYERREPWIVWLLDEWRPRRLALQARSSSASVDAPAGG